MKLSTAAKLVKEEGNQIREKHPQNPQKAERCKSLCAKVQERECTCSRYDFHRRCSQSSKEDAVQKWARFTLGWSGAPFCGQRCPLKSGRLWGALRREQDTFSPVSCATGKLPSRFRVAGKKTSCNREAVYQRGKNIHTPSKTTCLVWFSTTFRINSIRH